MTAPRRARSDAVVEIRAMLGARLPLGQECVLAPRVSDALLQARELHRAPVRPFAVNGSGRRLRRSAAHIWGSARRGREALRSTGTSRIHQTLSSPRRDRRPLRPAEVADPSVLRPVSVAAQKPQQRRSCRPRVPLRLRLGAESLPRAAAALLRALRAWTPAVAFSR